MRSQTQERIEELARERATTIDLALVEEGIEIGKRMMAEMIASYPTTVRQPSSVANANSAVSASTPRRGHRSGRLPQAKARHADWACIPRTTALIQRAKPVRCVIPLLPHRRHRASHRRAESLLVAILSREPPMTAAAFKQIDPRPSGLVQQLHGLLGLDPIGVLIGAKRASGTLIHEIAVHPDHRRQGHGRHLLTSLGSKLSILGPPRIVAEIPEALAPACEYLARADMSKKRG